MIHGSADFASNYQLERAGLLNYTNEINRYGLLLGLTEFPRREIRYQGDSHLLTIAPSRTGKTVGVVIPNLLSYDGSVVVTDIKGELAAVTASYREEVLSHKVYIINPWREEMKEALGGLDLGDAPFNPLAFLKADSPSLTADALMIAKMLVPLSVNATGSEKYFKEEAQSLLKLLICYLVLKKPKNLLNLPELRDTLLSEAESALKTLSQDNNGEDLIRSLKHEACSMVDIAEKAGKQYMAIFGEAKSAMAIYDGHGALGKHLTQDSGLDFKKIKQEKSTVYIVVPSHRLTDFRNWFDLVVGSAIKALSSAPPSGKVLFLLDEFGNMGYLPYIRDEVCMSAGKGIQFWFIMQEWAQFAARYGSGASTFWNQADIKQVFAIQEQEIVNLIKSRLGTWTAASVSTTERRYNYQYSLYIPQSPEQSITTSPAKVPLVHEYELYQLSDCNQFIFHANLPPIMAIKENYLNSYEYSQRAKSNPLYKPVDILELTMKYEKLLNDSIRSSRL